MNPSKPATRDRAERMTLGAAIAIAVLCSAMVVQGVVFKWEPVDDAYISFRYARNLADGHGLVYTADQRVEGYTNFLWTVLLAGGAAVGGQIDAVGKWLGVAFACVGVGLTWRLGRMVSDERAWPRGLAWAAPAILACYPGYSYWAFSGMEGPLLACLVTGFLLLACRPGHGGRKVVATGIVGALAAMTRPDAMIFWPIAVAAYLFGNTPLKQRLARSAGLCAVLLIGFGCYFVCRAAYYDQVLPNTFYAKTGVAALARLGGGVAYSMEFLAAWLVPVALVLWVLRRWGRATAILAGSMAVATAYVVWTGGDHFPWHRFFLPVFPVAAVMIVEIIHRLAGSNATATRHIALTLALLGTMAVTALRFDLQAATGHLKWVRNWKAIAAWVRPNVPQSHRMALAPVGVIGYYTGRPIVDLLGLTDPTIARFGRVYPSEPPGHQRGDIDYVLHQRPEIVLGQGLILTRRPTEQQAIDRSIRKVIKDMCRRADFRRLYRFEVAQTPRGYIPYWIRRDLPPLAPQAGPDG